MKFIHLVPLGNPDRRLLKELIPVLWDTFHVPAEVRECEVDLSAFYDRARGQYNSTAILHHLLQYPPIPPTLARAGMDEAALLAIVPVDLFIPILTFVFGEAQLNGPSAVVSYHRLQNERYGLDPDHALLVERLRKEVLHELGHTLGLFHCRNQECVMHSSTSVEEIDVKGGGFCPACAAVFGRGR